MRPVALSSQVSDVGKRVYSIARSRCCRMQRFSACQCSALTTSIIPGGPMVLHERSTFERAHVGGSQGEPLAVQAFGCEPRMPVRFDACGIVSSDRVNSLNLLGQLKCNLALASSGSIRFS